MKKKIKKIYESLTIWANIVAILIAISGLFIGNLKPEVSFSILSVLNIALRFKTKNPII